MKHTTVFMFVCLVFQSITLSGQEVNEPKNELGADALVLINSMLPSNSEWGGFLYPKYYITYKRHLNGVSFRAAGGGNSNVYERELNDVDLPFETENVEFYNFDYRVGIERPVALNDNWGFYYGLDFRQSIRRNYQEGSYTQNGYRLGFDSRANEMGLAPLFGFQWNINSRLNLQTEASVALMKTTSVYERLYTPIEGESQGELPISSQESDRKGFNIDFIVPNFLVFAIRI